MGKLGLVDLVGQFAGMGESWESYGPRRSGGHADLLALGVGERRGPRRPRGAGGRRRAGRRSGRGWSRGRPGRRCGWGRGRLRGAGRGRGGRRRRAAGRSGPPGLRAGGRRRRSSRRPGHPAPRRRIAASEGGPRAVDEVVQPLIGGGEALQERSKRASISGRPLSPRAGRRRPAPGAAGPTPCRRPPRRAAPRPRAVGPPGRWRWPN